MFKMSFFFNASSSFRK